MAVWPLAPEGTPPLGCVCDSVATQSRWLSLSGWVADPLGAGSDSPLFSLEALVLEHWFLSSLGGPCHRHITL